MTNNPTTGKMELTDVVEHENGDATYSFDVDEDTAKLTQELGLKLILYCGLCEVDIEEVFQLILDRGKYLSQEPDHLEGDPLGE